MNQLNAITSGRLDSGPLESPVIVTGDSPAAIDLTQLAIALRLA